MPIDGAGAMMRQARRTVAVLAPVLATVLATVLALPAGLGAPAAAADSEEASPPDPCCAGLFVLAGHYRFRAVALDDFAIDDQGTRHGQEVWGEQRLRLSPWVSFADTVFVRAEADFFSGPFFGDLFPVPSTDEGRAHVLRPMDRYYGLRRVEPRALWIEWRAPFGRLIAGQMTSQWGLGILANDGHSRWTDTLARPSEERMRFGDRSNGDIVERVAFAVPPVALFSDAAWARRLLLVGAFDVVFRDENASLLAGDLALQAVVSISYRADAWRVGAYVVYRDQEDDAGTTLTATVVDGFAQWRLAFDDDMALTLAAEAVVTTGHTDRVETERARDGLDLLGFGAALRVSFDWPATGFYPQLELGFASGDNDRGDDVNRSFTFDPDHRVGLVLFQQVLARMSARAVDQVSDPARRAVAPVGHEWLPSNGGVTNAFYLFPTVTYRPLRWLSVRFGLLYALAPADVIGPYASAKQGGFAANYLGGTSGAGSLGVELDGAVDFVWTWEGLFTVRAGVEGGVLFPGDALDGATVDLGTPWTVRSGVDLVF